MASLAKCPACNQDVSRAAKACPHCGQPLSFRPNWDNPRGFLILFVIVLVLWGFGSIGGSNQGSNNSAPSLAASDCRSDWTKCSDNSDMANHFRGWSDVQFACKRGANDLAKYGTPEWPWLAFSSFYKGTSYSSGIVTVVEPDAKFSNAFGAMVRSEVVCEYDLKNQKVTNVTIRPR